MPKKTEMIDIKHHFTMEEKAEKGEEMAKLYGELNRAEIEKSYAVSHYAALIKETKNKLDLIKQEISVGFELTSVRADLEYDYASGKVFYYVDGHVEKIRNMTDDERQAEIEFPDVGEQPEVNEITGAMTFENGNPSEGDQPVDTSTESGMEDSDLPFPDQVNPEPEDKLDNPEDEEGMPEIRESDPEDLTDDEGNEPVDEETEPDEDDDLPEMPEPDSLVNSSVPRRGRPRKDSTVPVGERND